MTKVFISHATRDRELVETAIVTLLNRQGISTWYAKEQISTGIQWEKKIREGLESCDWFLVALTPRAIASEWVRSETDWAIENRAGPRTAVPSWNSIARRTRFATNSSKQPSRSIAPPFTYRRRPALVSSSIAQLFIPSA